MEKGKVGANTARSNVVNGKASATTSKKPSNNTSVTTSNSNGALNKTTKPNPNLNNTAPPQTKSAAQTKPNAKPTATATTKPPPKAITKPQPTTVKSSTTSAQLTAKAPPVSKTSVLSKVTIESKTTPTSANTTNNSDPAKPNNTAPPTTKTVAPNTNASTTKPTTNVPSTKPVGVGPAKPVGTATGKPTTNSVTKPTVGQKASTTVKPAPKPPAQTTNKTAKPGTNTSVQKPNPTTASTAKVVPATKTTQTTAKPQNTSTTPNTKSVGPPKSNPPINKTAPPQTKPATQTKPAATKPAAKPTAVAPKSAPTKPQQNKPTVTKTAAQTKPATTKPVTKPNAAAASKTNNQKPVTKTNASTQKIIAKQNTTATKNNKSTTVISKPNTVQNNVATAVKKAVISSAKSIILENTMAKSKPKPQVRTTKPTQNPMRSMINLAKTKPSSDTNLLSHKNVSGSTINLKSSLLNETIKNLTPGGSFMIRNHEDAAHHGGHKNYLMRVKGRRNIKVRVITDKTLNDGDCFVFWEQSASEKRIWIWNGKSANQMEKSYGLTLANRIKDEDCKGRAQVVMCYQDVGKTTSSSSANDQDKIENDDKLAEFYKITGINSKTGIKEAESTIKDEEEDVQAHCIVTKFAPNLLAPESMNVESKISKNLLFSFPDSVFVFECSIIVFIWISKRSNNLTRNNAISFADEKLRNEKKEGKVEVMKVHEGIEPVVFKTQFTDWGKLPIGVAPLSKTMSQINVVKVTDFLEDKKIAWEKRKQDLVLTLRYLNRVQKSKWIHLELQEIEKLVQSNKIKIKETDDHLLNLDDILKQEQSQIKAQEDDSVHKNNDSSANNKSTKDKDSKIVMVHNNKNIEIDKYTGHITVNGIILGDVAAAKLLATLPSANKSSKAFLVMFKVTNDTKTASTYKTKPLRQLWTQESYIIFYEFDNYTGKKCIIIYFWQGIKSERMDKGKSAVLTVDLDDKTGGEGKQIRVEEGKEDKDLMDKIFRHFRIVHYGRQGQESELEDVFGRINELEEDNEKIMEIEDKLKRGLIKMEHELILERQTGGPNAGVVSSEEHKDVVIQEEAPEGADLQPVEDVTSVDKDSEQIIHGIATVQEKVVGPEGIEEPAQDQNGATNVLESEINGRNDDQNNSRVALDHEAEQANEENKEHNLQNNEENHEAQINGEINEHDENNQEEEDKKGELKKAYQELLQTTDGQENERGIVTEAKANTDEEDVKNEEVTEKNNDGETEEGGETMNEQEGVKVEETTEVERVEDNMKSEKAKEDTKEEIGGDEIQEEVKGEEVQGDETKGDQVKGDEEEKVETKAEEVEDKKWELKRAFQELLQTTDGHENEDQEIAVENDVTEDLVFEKMYEIWEEQYGLNIKQVDTPKIQYMKSSSCFLLLTQKPKSGSSSIIYYLWFGNLAESALKAKLIYYFPDSRLVREGTELDTFWSSFPGQSIKKYHHCLLNKNTVFNSRMYLFTAAPGDYCIIPVQSEYYYHSDLTDANIFLLFGGSNIFLWKGGRFVRNEDFKKALDLLESLAKEEYQGNMENIYILDKGFENFEFTSYFVGGWENGQYTSIELKDMHRDCHVMTLKTKLEILNKKWTWKELVAKPHELDQGNLESYLDDEEFQKVFKMTKQDFYKKPDWKQVLLKKEKLLF